MGFNNLLFCIGFFAHANKADLGTVLDNNNVVEYSVMFYYTPAAAVMMAEHADNVVGIKRALQNAIDDLNVGYKNSLINLRAVFFCALPISKFNPKTWELKSYGADAVVEVAAGEDTPVYGYGFMDTASSKRHGSSHVKVEGFKTFILGHEIGHNLGLHHDARNADENNKTNRGWLWKNQSGGGTGYYSIMAYPTAVYRTAANMYSSPILTHKGTNLKTGNEQADNRSRILRNMVKFAAMGDESGREECRNLSALHFGESRDSPTPKAPTTQPPYPPKAPITKCLASSPRNRCCVRIAANGIECRWVSDNNSFLTSSANIINYIVVMYFLL